MRAVDIHNGAGPATALFINDKIPIPLMQQGECVVKIKVFGINRGDLMQRNGLLVFPGVANMKHIMGLEFSGVIHEMREGEDDDDGWKVGDEVFGLLTGGGYAEFVNVPKRMLIRKPPGMSHEFAGGLCETWFTAMQALFFVGKYDPDDTHSVLWHAGASAVSIAGIQLSRIAHRIAGGASPPAVFGTARKEEKCNFITGELGATAALDTSRYPDKRSWAAEIKAMNGGRGVDLVIDFLGGLYLQGNLDVLERDGRMVMLGLLDGGKTPDRFDVTPIITKRVQLRGSQLRSRDLEYLVALRVFFEKHVLPSLIDGSLKHPVERAIPWENTQEAHELLESNKTKGKVVCVIT